MTTLGDKNLIIMLMALLFRAARIASAQPLRDRENSRAIEEAEGFLDTCEERELISFDKGDKE
jgi:hypothetical protein